MAVAAYSKGDAGLAEECAETLAGLIWNRRRDFTVRNTPVCEAVREAINTPVGPAVLVDVADNIGGGTPGDGTALLQELLRQRAAGAVLTIADPEAVAAAAAAGVGNIVNTAVGGKSDGKHGSPVPVRGYVRLLSDGVYTHRGSYMTGLSVNMGRTAVVVSDGVEIVLTERKAMPFDAEQLRCLRIEPAGRKMIVVKSAIAWKSAYGSLAQKVIYVDTPGLCTSNLLSLPYRKAPRPIFPLDEAASL
jgi:microcystin degradation protein MlrC